MTDKSVINNICASNTNDVDVIWPTSEFHENCLPVIGSIQVSSILSTFEPEEPEQKTTTNETFRSIPINIINNQEMGQTENTKNRKDLYKEMIYFGCNLCPFICPKDNKISDHIQNIHKGKNSNKKVKLKCPGCTNIFYHKLSLRSHLIYDHEIGKSDINKIVSSIVYVSVYQKHNQEKTKTLSDYVDVEMNSFENYENQTNFETKEETPPENIEKIEETNEEQKKTNEKKKHHKCCISTCAVRMSDVSNMAYHVKSHYDKIFRCLECNDNFITWKTLQTHLWRIHTIDMELYSCETCNYKTFSLAKLNNIHKLIHGNEKSFLCDLCGKGFKNPKQLRNHKIIHKTKTAEKTSECDICKCSFNDKRILKIHVQSVHQKLKPFACEYCNYKAASNADLKLHVRLHTGQKPFSCDQCTYVTADHNSLRKHKSRHTNEKKYKCAHCDYACIQSSTYKTHLKTKHPGLEKDHLFSCGFCQFRSVNKNKYLNHVASHKDNKKDAFDDVRKKNEDEQKFILPKKTRLDFTGVEGVSNCLIIPVETGPTSNLQYFYNANDVVLEVIDEKQK